MNREDIDKLATQGEWERLVVELEQALDEGYEEYNMLKLGQAYLFIGDEKKAKKIIRRLKMLFPSGEYYREEDALLEAINKGTIPEYLEKYCNSNTSKKEEQVLAQAQKEPIKLASVMKLTQQTKKERTIQENVRGYFAETIGLESVQAELDVFYKLLHLQNQRKQSDFKINLLKSTHFVISGNRGSGKTMIGEIIAKMLYDFEIRKEQKPVYVEARELFAAYDRDREDGIAQLLSKANDKVIIVENLDELIGSSCMDEVHERAILISLEKVLKERKEKVSLVLTCSVKAVERMRTLNSTIEDMIQTFVEIPTYSTIDLLKIAEKLATKKALRIHENGKKVLIRKIDMERRSPEFMNAITLNRYLDQAAGKMALRYYEMEHSTEADMVYLMPEDFEMELEEDSLEELVAELDALVGLEAVKEQIKKRIQTVSAERDAQNAGASRSGGHGSLHMLFTGNPGTGKTTVARMIGKIYQQLGILPRGNHMVECTRSNLVGQYQGHTANLVREKFKEAAGGVLFIDEAYALCRGDNDTFGHEAVDEIIAQMENNKDTMLVILAGYKKEMEEFLKSNSGFESRIRNRIAFEDYSVAEMADIFVGMAKGKKMQLDVEAEDALEEMLEIKSKTPNFGNARGVRNIFEEVVEAMNERLLEKKALGMVIEGKEYDTISVEDIQIVADKKLDGEKTLQELLEELDTLTGLGGVKQKVQEMVDAIQVQQLMQEQGMETSEEFGTLHLIFKGNAGTGKTTVARLLGKIYTKLGILKKNVFIEVGRNDLVAGYSGQTALKVVEKIEEADGGILFIDEVYNLVNGEQDEFGKEAINTLVAELENRRNNLVVIVAGYADKMEQFLSVNQGLASRLSNEINFEDYTTEELAEIFCYMAKQKHLVLEDSCKDAIEIIIAKKLSVAKDFGNARGVRNLLEQVERKKNSRIIAQKRAGESLTREDFVTVKLEDIKLL